MKFYFARNARVECQRFSLDAIPSGGSKCMSILGDLSGLQKAHLPALAPELLERAEGIEPSLRGLEGRRLTMSMPAMSTYLPYCTNR